MSLYKQIMNYSHKVGFFLGGGGDLTQLNVCFYARMTRTNINVI